MTYEEALQMAQEEFHRHGAHVAVVNDPHDGFCTAAAFSPGEEEYLEELYGKYLAAWITEDGIEEQRQEEPESATQDEPFSY